MAIQPRRRCELGVLVRRSAHAMASSTQPRATAMSRLFLFAGVNGRASDVKNLQNVEETTIHTPPRCEFDNALQVQLTIRRDGTAIPKFVYKSGGVA